MNPKRTDNNQQAIMDAFRALGFSVVSTHEIGHGFPDLVVAKDYQTYLVEVKMPGGRLTNHEKEFAKNWRDTVIIVHSIDDLLDKFGG